MFGRILFRIAKKVVSLNSFLDVDPDPIDWFPQAQKHWEP